KRLAVLVLMAAAAAGCGDDPTGPSTPNVAGAWSYAATNVTAATVTCSFTNVSLSLTQSGTTFSGTYSGGLLSCSAPGASFSEPIGGGPVASGTINGTSVTFDMDSSDWRNTGTISGNSMSGTVNVRVVVEGVPIVLTGNFSAARV
ncbi:MAG: hypothetical protein ABFS34_16160, partial [Gemmatimonadota bacterium]